MSRSTLLFIFTLTLLTFLLGYNYFVQPFKDIFTVEVIQPTTSSPEPELSVEELVKNQLSLKAKIWQLLAVPHTVTATPSAELAEIHALGPGFVTLFGERISTDSARQVAAQLRASDTHLPIFIAVDHEGGSVQRLSGSGFTRLPSWQELCQLPPETRAIILQKTASELATAGVRVIFAPMVDVASHSAVLGNRVCSDDPTTIISASQQFITHFSSHNILPVLKHFPGIGSARKDLHLNFDRITVTEADATIYRELLRQFSWLGVMISHAGVENQFRDIPCSLSEACVGELSRNFPEALIFTDALEMEAAAYNGQRLPKNLPQISSEALQAGNNVLVYGKGVSLTELEKVVSELEAQAATDSALLNKIDHSLTQVIRYKLSPTYEHYE